MNDITITQEQVNAAADAICAEGNKPTVLDVRKRMKSGSISAVWRLFQVWQTTQAEPIEQATSVSTELQKTLEEFITRQVTSVKALYESEIQSLRQINSELMVEIEQHEKQVIQQDVELNSARAIKNEISGRFEQLNAELKRAREEIEVEKESATQSRMELVKAQLKLESVPRLEADLDQLYKTLEQERVAKLNAEHSAKALTAKLETEVAARKKAETDLLDLLRRKEENAVRV
jgi:colicin import membrane protein